MILVLIILILFFAFIWYYDGKQTLPDDNEDESDDQIIAPGELTFDDNLEDPPLYNIKVEVSPVNKKQDPDYNYLLQRPEWIYKAIRIKERDGHCCKYCGNVCNLQVHHKYYSRYPNGMKVMPWNYPDDALITLCQNCHEKVHKTKKIKLYYRKYTDNYV